MKAKHELQAPTGRREFLKQIAVGSGAVAVAAVSGGALAAVEPRRRRPSSPRRARATTRRITSASTTGPRRSSGTAFASDRGDER